MLYALSASGDGKQSAVPPAADKEPTPKLIERLASRGALWRGQLAHTGRQTAQGIILCGSGTCRLHLWASRGLLRHELVGEQRRPSLQNVSHCDPIHRAVSIHARFRANLLSRPTSKASSPDVTRTFGSAHLLPPMWQAQRARMTLSLRGVV
jgi:hypothetical protein